MAPYCASGNDRVLRCGASMPALHWGCGTSKWWDACCKCGHVCVHICVPVVASVHMKIAAVVVRTPPSSVPVHEQVAQTGLTFRS